MIIESGIIVFLGLLLLAVKLPKRTALWWLGRPLTVDLIASAVAYLLHFGTFTGAMAAAVAGLMCSGFTTIARWMFGYIDERRYFPGVIRVQLQSNRERRPSTARA